MIRGKKNNQKGFTVVELMIATVIFSLVLVIASSSVIAIGRLYYKGITSAKTQNAARMVMEDISRSIQFSKGYMGTEDPPAPGGEQAFCFGVDVYSYRINTKVDLDVADARALVHTARGDGDDLTKCIPDFTGKELLADNMRLLDFSITSPPTAPNQSNIFINVAYGDNDLLTHYDDSGNLIGSAGDARCKGGAGSYFCSTAQLATVVSKRLK
ncbi:prepilin-type N-terminal cleavage/methylation domain-containing protein [Candidatus Parcubacteria bacterium]|nr:prepilin-type N-terminal cleavage/methylation domain-containing protein [Candidatus Parcubacteria bacterium]